MGGYDRFSCSENLSVRFFPNSAGSPEAVIAKDVFDPKTHGLCLYKTSSDSQSQRGGGSVKRSLG